MGIFTNRSLAFLLLCHTAAAQAQAPELTAISVAQQWLSSLAAEKQWQNLQSEIRLLPLRQAPPPCIKHATGSVSEDSQPSRIYVIVRCDGHSYRYLLRARVSMRLPVAARNLAAGERITEDAIHMQQASPAQTQQLLTTSSDLKGQSVRVAVRAGQPFYSGQIDMPLLVKNGSKVDIQAEQDGIVASMQGIAQQSGRAGEWISVKNIRSGKIVRAKIMSAGLVSAELVRSPPAQSDE